MKSAFEIVHGPIFFKPNTQFVKWLIKYAGDRIIMDVGCGSTFQLTQQLYFNGAKKLVAIDPEIDYTQMQLFRIKKTNPEDSVHILQGTVEKWKDILNAKHQDILVICARPCHSDWVEEMLDLKNENVEVLYITLPENLELYDDLGKWKYKAVLLNHEGSSADKEVVYSIK